MLTQQDINEEIEFLQTRQNEKWAQKKLEKWARIQDMFNENEELKAEIYFEKEANQKATEMLQICESVFDSLGFLGTDFRIFVKEPKPINFYYMICLLRLLPNDHAFKEPLKQYLNGISNQQIKEAHRNAIARQSAALAGANRTY